MKMKMYWKDQKTGGHGSAGIGKKVHELSGGKLGIGLSFNYDRKRIDAIDRAMQTDSTSYQAKSRNMKR